MYKGKSLDQSFASGEGEGTINDIKELVDLIGGEFLGGVHTWGVAAHTARVKLIVWGC
jgi:hypothetical protein